MLLFFYCRLIRCSIISVRSRYREKLPGKCQSYLRMHDPKRAVQYLSRSEIYQCFLPFGRGTSDGYKLRHLVTLNAHRSSSASRLANNPRQFADPPRSHGEADYTRSGSVAKLDKIANR